MDQVLQGRKTRNRPLVVKRIERDSADLPDCHVLFASSWDEVEPAAMRTLLANPVLTISDTLNPAGSSIINFLVLDNKVSFEINLGISRQAGLEIGSRLLALATTVTP